ncbi:MAG TPA: phenylalanine 4-monooxygenase [Longimicrobiales bacterium]|nr:phenylalanine 4-monooxygenase [Longimicrobiales bacterium]
MSTETIPLIEQDWLAYTDENHEVWGLLYARRMQELTRTGSKLFLEGADTIGLSQDAVPDLDDVNARLRRRTGWQAVAVKGFIPAADFFSCLADRRFPTTIIVRSKSQMDYLPEPDIFHDVFGHVPLHADPVFAEFLQRFGRIAGLARTEEETTWMARLFWFSVEFGLIEEGENLKVYGSGLISSAADAANALSDKCTKRPFELDAVINQSFEIDRLQDTLFVVKSFGQLFDAVSAMESRLI